MCGRKSNVTIQMKAIELRFCGAFIILPPPLFLIRTSNFLAEAEPKLNVFIFWRFEPEPFLIILLRLICSFSVNRSSE